MENKNNDWLVVSLNMADASHEDLIDNGIDTSNTTLKDRSFYKDTQVVKEMFTKPNSGEFDEAAYNKYYDTLAYGYNQFSDKEFTDKAMNDVSYHPFNDFKQADAKVSTDMYKVNRIANPYRQTMGMAGINKFSAQKYSARELGQMNNVYDSATGKKLDWTPNDSSKSGLFDFLTTPTLVLAQYESDGEHYDEDRGQNVKHKKGDLKSDAKGFYYETLGNREVYGKQVLNWADTLTEEGTWIDDYNFMESDGLDKSIAGTVAKTATKIAAMSIPYYGLALAGVELMNVIPMIAKAGIGLFVGDAHKDKPYWESLNRVQGVYKRMSTSDVSDAAHQSMVTTENFGQLVTDIVGQLKSQRAIASIPTMVGGKRPNVEGLKEVYAYYGKSLGDKMLSGSLNAFEKAQIIERIPQAAGFINRTVKNIEVARALSTTYMAATSAVGATEAAKALGLDERDTASLYLGTLLGYYTIMRALPIGEWATKGIGLDDAGKIASGVVQKNAKILAEQSGRLVTEAGEAVVDSAVEGAKKTGMGKLIQNASTFNSSLVAKGKEWGKEIFLRLQTADGWEGAVLSEAAEEMSEEAMEDAIKGVYNAFSSMGYTSTDDKKFQYGSLKEIAARYAMAGFGGGLGGAIFHFSDRMGKSEGEDSKATKQEENIIRNHGIEEMLKEVGKWEEKGMASKTLTFETEDITMPNGQVKTVFKAAPTYQESQNHIVANILRQRYRNMQDQIFQEGVLSNIELAAVYDDRADSLIKVSANSPLFDDYNEITNRILTLRKEIADISATTPEDAKSSDTSMVGPKAESIGQKQIQLAQARLELKAIHSGEKFNEYQRFALFAINSSTATIQDGEIVPGTSISEPFVKTSLNNFAIQTTGSPFKSLNEPEQKSTKEKYDAFLALSSKDRLRAGFKRFTFVNEKVSLDAAALGELDQSLRESVTYLGQTEEGHSLAGATLVEPTKENLAGLKEHKETLTTNVFKDDVINSILDPRHEAYTLSNRIVGLTNVEALVDGVVKLPQDIAKDLLKTVNFKVSELIKDTEGSGEDLTEYEVYDYEVGSSQTIKFNMPALSELYGGDGSKVIAKEVTNSKLQDIQAVYDKYVEIINNSSSTEEAKKESLESLKNMFDYINSITPEPGVTIEQLAKIQTSLSAKIQAKSLNLLEEVLKKFELKVNGKSSDLVELLTDEFMAISKLEEITEYEINDTDVLENLTYMSQTLAELKSVIMAMTNYSEVDGTFYGLNLTINKTFPDNQVGTITQEQSVTLLQQIGVIESRVKFLTELAKLNGEDQIKNQKESGFIMEAMFFEQLTAGKGLRTYLEGVKIHGEPFLSPELISTIEHADLINGVLVAHRAKSSDVPKTIPEMQAFEEQVVQIQMALNERYKYFISKSTGANLEAKNIDVFTQLYGIQDGEMSAQAKIVFPPLDMTFGLPTSFSSSETRIQPLALYMWLNTNMAINTIDFADKLLGIPTENGELSGIDNNVFAPFYGQEFGAKMLFAYSSNPVFMKQSALALHSKEGFLPKLIKPFVHGVLLSGGPGTGKSTAVVQPLARMLREAGMTYWSAAPFTRQAKTLDNTFGNTSEKVLNKEELLLSILNNDASLLAAVQNTDNWELVKDTYAGVNEQGQSVQSVSNFYMLKQSVIDDIKSKSPKIIEGLPPAIFVDEVTHFSNAELAAIDAVFSGLTTAPVLYMMGDTRQNGFLYKGERHNINMFNILSTPKLSKSVRNSNNHKKRNLDNVAAFYNFVEEKYRYASLNGGDSRYYLKVLQDVADFANDPKNGLRLMSHTSASGKVYGEKIINPNALSVGLVRQLVTNLSDGRTLGFITDDMNSDIVKAIQLDPTLAPMVSILDAKDVLKVNIQKEDTVQGLEYEDVVVNVDWAKYYGPEQEAINFGARNFMSNLYTLITRSESGTVIVDNGFTTYSTIPVNKEGNAQEYTSDTYQNTKLNPTLVEEFKKGRSTILKNIVEKYKTDKTEEAEEKSPFNAINTPSSTPRLAPDVLTEDEWTYAEMAQQSELISRGSGSLRTVSIGDMTNSHLIAYPYYERSGANSNEDLQYFLAKGNSITDARIKLKNLKMALLYKKGTQRTRLLSSILGDSSEPTKIKLFVRGSKFNEATDKSKIGFNKKGQMLSNNDAFLRIVVEVPRKGETSLFFTVAALGLADTVQEAKKPVLEQKIRKIENEIANGIPDNDFATVKDYEITDPDYLENLAPFTNLQMEQTDTPVTFEEFKKDYEGMAVISNPYIITGKVSGDIIKDPTLRKAYEEWISGIKDGKKVSVSLAGRGCCYVSFDSTIPAEKLREIYEEERAKALANPANAPIPTVKMVMLDQKAYKPMEWFKATRDAMNDHRKKGAKKITSAMSTMAAPAISARILNSFIKVLESTQGSKNQADIATNRIITLTLTRLSAMFGIKEGADPTYKKLVGIFSSSASIKKYLGEKEIVHHYFHKDGTPAWGGTRDEDAKYIAFEHNNLYKLMVAIEIAMFGGTVKIDKEEVEYSPAIDGINMQGDEDFLAYIEDIFDSHFTDTPEFKHGIFSHAVYNQGYSAQKTPDRNMQAVELALNLNFMVNVKLSLPNILIDVDTIKSPEDVIKHQETLKEKLERGIAIAAKQATDKLEAVRPSAISKGVENELNEAIEKIQDAIGPVTWVPEKGELEGMTAWMEEIVNDFLAEIEEEINVFENLHRNFNAQQIIEENVDQITQLFPDQDFSKAEISIVSKNSNDVNVFFDVLYKDEARKIVVTISPDGTMEVTRNSSVKKTPQTEDEFVSTYGKLAKKLESTKEKYAYANDPFLVDTIVAALNSGDLNKIREIIQKNPRVLITFIAGNEDQITKDFLSILEEKDQDCPF